MGAQGGTPETERVDCPRSTLVLEAARTSRAGFCRFGSFATIRRRRPRIGRLESDSAVKSFALGRDRRIKNSQDFASIYEKRIRASDGNMLVFAAPNPLPHARFGVSVSRKLGSAVRRTALKRLLREAFRLSQHELPSGVDLILIPQRATAETAGLEDYRRSLIKLAARLARQIAAQQNGPPT
jgi:ribonuclease P protein component